MKTISFAFLALVPFAVACSAGGEGVNAGVEPGDVTTQGVKGCNKHVDCDDGNPCTADTCVHGRGCQYSNAPAGTACTDGNACTSGDTCVAGACSGSPVVCVAADQCRDAGTCDPATGACPVLAAAKADGTTCNDGNSCTAHDTCTAGICGVPQAGKYTFTEIAYPGAENMAGTGINSFGDVVGFHQSSPDWAVHGFIFHAASGTYTGVDHPDVTDTYLAAIDDAGRALGYYAADGANHPFIYANGTFTNIAVLDNSNFVPMGWNAAGDIVGAWGAGGFVLHNGVITTVAVPGAMITGATGINAAGDVAGYSLDTDADGHTVNPRGFILRNGTYDSFTYPGAVEMGVSGMSGDTVVGTQATPDLERHAFVYRNATFTNIDVDGAPSTYATGINATGQVLGTYDKGPFRIATVFVATPATNACVAP